MNSFSILVFELLLDVLKKHEGDAPFSFVVTEAQIRDPIFDNVVKDMSVALHQTRQAKRKLSKEVQTCVRTETNTGGNGRKKDKKLHSFSPKNVLIIDI